MKNWTISCHECGNNHAEIVRRGDEGEYVVECQDKCGASQSVAEIVLERD